LNSDAALTLSEDKQTELLRMLTIHSNRVKAGKPELLLTPTETNLKVYLDMTNIRD
jgi:hypothetical protein